MKTKILGDFQICISEPLRILTGKKHRQIKLQRFQKAWIWTFGWLVNQINSLVQLKTFNFKSTQKVFNWNKIQKNKIVTGKTSFFVIGPFYTHHSICLNIGFWYGSFPWKWCIFKNGKKSRTPFFWKRFLFSRKFVSKL